MGKAQFMFHSIWPEDKWNSTCASPFEPYNFFMHFYSQKDDGGGNISVLPYTNSGLQQHLPANAGFYEANKIIAEFYKHMVSNQQSDQMQHMRFSLTRFRTLFPYPQMLVTEQEILKVPL